MAEAGIAAVARPADDVYCWLEQDSSVMLKAVTSFGDPVELTAHEAREIAAALLTFADRLEPPSETHAEPAAAPDGGP
jgi:hypothetical protein